MFRKKLQSELENTKNDIFLISKTEKLHQKQPKAKIKQIKKLIKIFRPQNLKNFFKSRNLRKLILVKI